jgi:hypothetical protein
MIHRADRQPVIPPWLKQIGLVTLAICLSTATAGETTRRLTIGGPIRAGGFSLSKDAREAYTTGLSYQDRALENALGKQLMVEYRLYRYGLGLRWGQYTLTGQSDTLEQELISDYTLLTLSITLLEGRHLHPKLSDRIGLTVGHGRNRLQLTTRTHRSLTIQTQDDTIGSTGEVDLIELFFEAITHSGWGYQLGYYHFFTKHQTRYQGHTLNGSSDRKIGMTIIRQF